ncbi:MAG: acyl-CoA thioester hydrolase/BAAT C-terminal domain-containing protein, partial [Caulobacteraceae bacterium]
APGLLILGGSEGGHGPAFHFAATFARRGFASLGLAYFADPGLPATLENVPLEYFTAAIDWLVAQPGVDPKRIGVFGGSKGAEAALLVASRDPRIKAVVAGVPSSVAWQGVNMANPANPGPSWTLNGKPIPYAHYDGSQPFRGILDLYQRSLAKAPPEAVIPVERINGPVLLVSAKSDGLWPSAAMGDAVISRLDKAKFRFPHTNLAYADAGHAGFGEPLPPGSAVPPAMLAQLGGTAQGNLAMRADAWPKILAFLDQVLKPERKA